MLTNYIKTAFRSFKRHKSSFFINVSSLSIGMACSILILLWVLDELNVDGFHAEADRIYQLMEHQSYSDAVMTTLSTPGILAPALKEEVPEFEYVAVFLIALFTISWHSIRSASMDPVKTLRSE